MRFLKQTFALVVASMALGACNNDDEIYIGQNYLATVVSDEVGQITLQVDGAKNFYTSPVLWEDEENLAVGDRLMLRFFEVNYDNQPSGATGAEVSPYVLSQLSYNKVTTYVPIEENSPSNFEGMEIPRFNAPYFVTTVNGDSFLNMRFRIPARTEQDYALVYLKTSNDTVYYDFKAMWNPSEGVGDYLHIKTFRLTDIPDKGTFNITFDATRYDPYGSGFLNDSTYVLNYTITQ